MLSDALGQLDLRTPTDEGGRTVLRQDVLSDIESTLGIVPGFMDGMPNMVLEHTWAFLKDFLKDKASEESTVAVQTRSNST